MEYRLIVAIVKRGKADEIVDAAKKNGVEGATIFYARGTSIHKKEAFFGIRLPTEQEVIWMIVPESEADDALEKVIKAGELTKSGMGVAFVLTLDQVVGIVHHSRLPEELG